MTRITASARSMARIPRSKLKCSSRSRAAARRRMPAVSTSTTGSPSKLRTVSTGSRVVPGISLTSARSSPSRALSSDDLPTFGRPMIASRAVSSSAGSAPGRDSGRASIIRSIRSSTPIPCCAETITGSGKPSSRISWRKCSWPGLSALLAATRVGLPDRRRRCAMSRSTGTRPLRTSSRRMISCASAMAARVCASMAAREPSSSPPGSSPAVSTTVNSWPRHSATPYRRSRVSPARSSTIAFRQPIMRLNSVDLPTFGRPTMATIALATS